MAFTQAQLDRLEEAIATGTKRLEYEGKVTEFQSLEQMLDLRLLMIGELNPGQGGGRRFTLSAFRKGTARDD
jgi:hypothetical protein